MTPLVADQALAAAARQARRFAYAPYSGFLVGAALRLQDGTTVLGANVENASYGLTICAERSAVVAAVTSHGLRPGGIVAIAVAVDAAQAAAPCGACRQVLFEFTGPDGLVTLFNERTQETQVVALQTLLPWGFGPSQLGLPPTGGHTSHQ